MIDAGRAFVAAYVPLTHWVEGLHGAATGGGEHHGAPAGEVAHTAEPAAGTHAAAEPAARTHAAGAHARLAGHLPWIIAGVLAIAAAVEAVLLLRRRRPVPVT